MPTTYGGRPVSAPRRVPGWQRYPVEDATGFALGPALLQRQGTPCASPRTLTKHSLSTRPRIDVLSRCGDARVADRSDRATANRGRR